MNPDLQVQTATDSGGESRDSPPETGGIEIKGEIEATVTKTETSVTVLIGFRYSLKGVTWQTLLDLHIF